MSVVAPFSVYVLKLANEWKVKSLPKHFQSDATTLIKTTFSVTTLSIWCRYSACHAFSAVLSIVRLNAVVLGVVAPSNRININ